MLFISCTLLSPHLHFESCRLGASTYLYMFRIMLSYKTEASHVYVRMNMDITVCVERGTLLSFFCMFTSVTQGRLMHHTVTAIAGGKFALVIGGRSSPAQPSGSIHLLELDKRCVKWSKKQLHPDSVSMEPRWRHTATCLQLQDGEDRYIFK